MLSNLPQELILEILSRIPIKDVCRCKSVCKSWLKQIETPEFARSHLSKSADVPGLLISHVMEQRTTELKVLECSRLTDIFINQDWRTRIECSINGLVFFRKTTSPEEYYICNPITRQYVKLPRPKPYYGDDIFAHYGFGVSSKSGQYKVVRMLDRDPKFVCQVYTLGGRNKWRRIAPPSSPGKLEEYSGAEFLNGNLHWLAEDSCSDGVFCLDLETETFSKFPAPTLESDHRWFHVGLGVLRRCLSCLCDDDADTEFVIYTMSCYDKKSWVKECVIRKSPHIFIGANPIMIFGDSNGGVLMALEDLEDSHLFCYSNTTNKRIDFNFNFNHDDCGDECYFEASFYTPSFVSLGDSFKIRVIKYY